MAVLHFCPQHYLSNKRYCTKESDEAVSVLWVALVAHHLLVGDVEGTLAAAGGAGVTGGLGSAVGPPPTQSQAAPKAH